MDSAKQQTFEDTLSGFQHSLLRAMLVAGEDFEGRPKRMTQHQLSKLSGVARSTIAKYLTQGPENLCNPDLSTICRLADALNISPAFLLMRPQDWSHLSQGSVYLASALGDSKFLSLGNQIKELNFHSSYEASVTGLKIAELFGLYQDKEVSVKEEKLHYEILQRKIKARKGILAMAALPPFGKIYKSAALPLLSLCVILGAHLS